MSFKKPRLKANLAAEGSVSIPAEWRELDGLVRADILKDWIGILQIEYDIAVLEMIDGPDRRLKAAILKKKLAKFVQH
jgi:hypothetical protein